MHLEALMPAVAAALTARDLVPGRTARLQVGDSIETAIGVLTQKGVSSLPVLDGRRLDSVRVAVISHISIILELSK